MIGTPCSGSSIVPVVDCPTYTPGNLITLTPPPPSATYQATLATVTDFLLMGSHICTFTYSDVGVAQPTWTEELTVRVFCYADSIGFDTAYPSPTYFVYDLKAQTLMIDGDTANLVDMLPAPYS